MGFSPPNERIRPDGENQLIRTPTLGTEPNSVRNKPNIVDLFCGCGGFSLGAHAGGLGATLAIDSDAILTSSFTYNFPRTRLVHADLSKIDGSDLIREASGQIEGIFGGPPCQAFSGIGQRNQDDPRRNLLRRFFLFVRDIKPKFFVMENVPGLGFEDTRPFLNRSLSLIPDRYEVLGPIILDAANFGAATRRPRLFVIGYDPRHCDKLTLDDIEKEKVNPATVRAAIGDLSNALPLVEIDGHDIWKIQKAGRPSRYAEALRSPDRTFTGHRRTKHTADVVKRFKALEQGETDSVGRHPRLEWAGQCPTLRAGTGNDRGSYQSVRPVHPDEPRVITVREAARLQGFPDQFRFHPTIWHSFRMIGNSVSPIVARMIFSLLAARVETGARVAAE